MLHSEYHRLTESIKTWVAECKADSSGELLSKLLSYPYSLEHPCPRRVTSAPNIKPEQRLALKRLNENHRKPNFEDLRVLDEPSIKKVDDIPFKPAKNAILFSTPKQRQKGSSNLESKIEYFELKIQNKKSNASPKSRCKSPIVKELFTKKNAVNEVVQKINNLNARKVSPINTEDYVAKRCSQFREKIEFFESFFSKHEFCNISQKKNKIEEKFIVNLYESAATLNLPKTKPVSMDGGIIKQESKLYIKQEPEVENLELPQCSNLQIPCVSPKVAIISEHDAYNRSSSHMDDSSSISSSQISYLLDGFFDGLTTEETPESMLTALTQELHEQGHILNQATKAVEMCKRLKKFENSEEQLEAERILLAAGLKRELLLREIRKIQYEPSTESIDCNYRGRLTISNLKFPLVVSDDKTNNFFIVTVSVGTVLLVSHIVNCKPTDEFLEFPEGFVFENVGLDELVNINIYKASISQTDKQSCLPTPSCFKRRDVRRQSMKLLYKDSYSGLAKESEILPSIFTSCGFLQISVNHLVKAKTSFLLQNNTHNSLLYGAVKLMATLID